MKDNNGKFYVAFGVLIVGTGLYFIFQSPPQFDAQKYIEVKGDLISRSSENSSDVEGVLESVSKTEALLQRKEIEQGRRPAKMQGDSIGKKQLSRTHKSLRNKREQYTLDTEVVYESNKFEANEIQFEKIENFYAIFPEDYLPNNYEKVQELNGLYIIKYDGDIPDGALSVVKNNDTNNLAIFTGILRVKLKDFDSADGLMDLINQGIVKDSKKVDPEINTDLSHIRVATYKFSNYENTIFVYNILRTEAFENLVERINIDLIEWKRTSN
ncbi:MAG: hypothetical protein ACJAS4_002987 [Bacteriovoracaceae bacterium]